MVCLLIPSFCTLLIILTIDSTPETTGVWEELEKDDVGMWAEYHTSSVPVLYRLAASHIQDIAQIVLHSVDWH